MIQIVRKEDDVIRDTDAFFGELDDNEGQDEPLGTSSVNQTGLSADEVHKLADDFYNPLPPANPDS
jgi:hypothetical protein